MMCVAGDAGDSTDAAWLSARLCTQTPQQRWVKGAAQLVCPDRQGQLISRDTT